MKISQLPENIEVSLQNSVIYPVKTFFLWWADLLNVILTRSSKDECSIGSNNHLMSTDLFRSQIIEFNRSKNLDDTAPSPFFRS